MTEFEKIILDIRMGRASVRIDDRMDKATHEIIFDDLWRTTHNPLCGEFMFSFTKNKSRYWASGISANELPENLADATCYSTNYLINLKKKCHVNQK